MNMNSCVGNKDLELLAVVRFLGRDGFYARKKEHLQSLQVLEKVGLVRRKKGSKRTFIATKNVSDWEAGERGDASLFTVIRLQKLADLVSETRTILMGLENSINRLQQQQNVTEGLTHERSFLRNEGEEGEKESFFQSVKDVYRRKATSVNPLVKVSEIWQEVRRISPLSREKFENYLLELHDAGKLTLQTAVSSLNTMGGIRVPHGIYNYVVLE